MEYGHKRFQAAQLAAIAAIVGKEVIAFFGDEPDSGALN